MRNDNEQKNISAEQSEEKSNPRLPGAHVHKGGQTSPQASPGQGAKASDRLRPMADEARPPCRASACDTESRNRQFRPHERLHRSIDYGRVKREGRRYRTAHFGISIAPNDLDYHRLGMVVQKRFWSATGRNRIKRCLREFFRLHKHRIPLPGKDIVIVARPGALELPPAQIASELLPLFLKPGGAR